ncbi:TetR/AcrR family transcriptional regulator [Marinactinospora thermotolerans]|uniref:TetR/AcrR family transcriptional regulator n=1 Tax=Marinactinospora thermotolerans TaxID=531310 RepID=UPI003D91ED85
MIDGGGGGDAVRHRVLEAVLRLVERGGVAEASLRRVAEESGVNIGSVRHRFGSHEALLTAAAEEVGARMERRLDAALLDPPGPSDVAGRRALLEHVVAALLPEAPEERAELVALHEFVAAARIHPAFRPLAARMGRDMRALLRRALDLAGVADLDVETERLVALVSGLTFDLVHPHGAGADTPAPHDVLRHHVAALIPG